MHIPDGFLSPQLTLPALVLAAPLAIWAAKRGFGPSEAEKLPVVGTLTALAFVIQTIMVPVPGGTSVHLMGVTLLALLYEPLTAFLCETLVLLLQALFFGAGGLTVLGVNALAMGLAGPLCGWLLFRLARPMGEKVAAFAAAWGSMQIDRLSRRGPLAAARHRSLVLPDGAGGDGQCHARTEPDGGRASRRRVYAVVSFSPPEGQPSWHLMNPAGTDGCSWAAFSPCSRSRHWPTRGAWRWPGWGRWLCSGAVR